MTLKKKKTRSNGYAYEFSVDYDIIDTSNIIDIRKYLMITKNMKKLVCVVKKSILNMITVITEPKTLTKYISCESKSKFDEQNSSQINGEITINVNVNVKYTIYMKKIV